MSRGGRTHRSETRPELKLGERVPVFDIATDSCIGYVSSRYLNTCARPNLIIWAKGEACKILHITKDETVLLLPMGLNFLNPRIDPRLKAPQENISMMDQVMRSQEYASRYLPAVADNRIIFEGFQNYLIVHTQFGQSINITLSLILDTILTEQDLIRDIYCNNSGILIQTPAKMTREEIESINEDLFGIGLQEMQKAIRQSIEARFPDFGDLGELAGDSQRAMQERETRKEEFASSIEARGANSIYRTISEKRLTIQIYLSSHSPSPAGAIIIDETAQHAVDEMKLIIKFNRQRFKKAIGSEKVEFLCLNCLTKQTTHRVKELDGKPRCNKCDSSLLSIMGSSDRNLVNLFRKKKAGSRLNPIEKERLAHARRTADLVLSYGKRAAIALSVTGIGPQTASAILAAMHIDESTFYDKLLEAKIHYLKTSELWKT